MNLSNPLTLSRVMKISVKRTVKKAKLDRYTETIGKIKAEQNERYFTLFSENNVRYFKV